ncbi:hypothetical protein [Polycladomyces subterraneus]|uniref:Transposase n=1 Tax=Polycladomyces subterraneus TaxID=1016997 RepID=A0ABT8IR66_9BACL|nr:hypothetical protein [Polycladomyces subterraneus]MDN4595213.1 hypothetical protein [Polycladomyces subterraneus]
MGIVYPVYIAISDSPVRYHIEGGEIERFRRQVERRRKQLLKQGKYCGDGRRGHGRQTRIKPIEALSEKIANFRKTTNHKYARYVVDLALKQKCGTIALSPAAMKHWPITMQPETWPPRISKKSLNKQLARKNITIAQKKTARYNKSGAQPCG